MRSPHYTKLPIVIETEPPLNGYVNHHERSPSSSTTSSALSSPTGRHSPQHPSVQRLAAIVRSAIPQLLFLCVYSLNGRLHILPRFEDLGHVRLYNVSAAESVLFGTPLHLRVSAVHYLLLDFISGLPYLFHYVIPLVYPLYLWVRGQVDDVARFYWLLGWSSWALYVIWFILPTAPPWLYDTKTPWPYASAPRASGETNSTIFISTLSVTAHLHKEGCAFQRVDAMTGIPLFFHLFRNNPVPFASFPSGHVLWPTCIYVTSAPGGRWFALYIFWVAWATLYSCHHYLSDAMAAVAVAFIVKRLLAYAAERRPWTHGLSCHAVPCPLNMV